MRKSNITPEDAPGCDICRVHYVIILPVVTAVLLELRSSAMSDGARECRAAHLLDVLSKALSSLPQPHWLLEARAAAKLRLEVPLVVFT